MSDAEKSYKNQIIPVLSEKFKKRCNSEIPHLYKEMARNMGMSIPEAVQRFEPALKMGITELDDLDFNHAKVDVNISLKPRRRPLRTEEAIGIADLIASYKK